MNSSFGVHALGVSTAEGKWFFDEAWSRLLPTALSQFVDFGEYVFTWAGILGAHFVKFIAAAVGFDPEVIKFVSFIEKWVWIATFAAFFVRILIRLGHSLLKEAA